MCSQLVYQMDDYMNSYESHSYNEPYDRRADHTSLLNWLDDIRYLKMQIHKTE